MSSWMDQREEIKSSLMGRDFLTLAEFSTPEIVYLLDEAARLKKMQKAGERQQDLAGQVLGMIFEKSSTRTRVSFEVGMLQLGGHPIFLSSKDIQLGRGETIHDTAQTLSRYVDGVMIRTFGHEIVVELAEHASIPVINGLTDTHHPAQVLADLQTIMEHKGKLEGLKMCFIGDGHNNVTHSLIEGAVKVGMHISIASPEGYLPNQAIVEQAREAAQLTGSQIELSSDSREAMENADVVVTDVWSSMGFEEEQQERLAAFRSFQVNEELVQRAKPDYIFLHCLPAHRGEEVTAAIIDGAHSVVFDEAENRLHAQKAIMKSLMQKK